MKSFKDYLVEETKLVTFAFGRFNPPTTGHEKLLNTVASSSDDGDYVIIPSRSQDKKKNPLDYKYKVKTVRKFFPKHARSVMLDKKVKNVFDAVTEMYNDGFKNISMVVGSDRINEFNTL